MKCEKCGHEPPEERARFCSMCGNSMQLPVPANTAIQEDQNQNSALEPGKGLVLEGSKIAECSNPTNIPEDEPMPLKETSPPCKKRKMQKVNEYQFIMKKNRKKKKKGAAGEIEFTSLPVTMEEQRDEESASDEDECKSLEVSAENNTSSSTSAKEVSHKSTMSERSCANPVLLDVKTDSQVEGSNRVTKEVQGSTGSTEQEIVQPNKRDYSEEKSEKLIDNVTKDADNPNVLGNSGTLEKLEQTEFHSKEKQDNKQDIAMLEEVTANRNTLTGDRTKEDWENKNKVANPVSGEIFTSNETKSRLKGEKEVIKGKSNSDQQKMDTTKTTPNLSEENNNSTEMSVVAKVAAKNKKEKETPSTSATEKKKEKETPSTSTAENKKEKETPSTSAAENKKEKETPSTSAAENKKETPSTRAAEKKKEKETPSTIAAENKKGKETSSTTENKKETPSPSATEKKKGKETSSATENKKETPSNSATEKKKGKETSSTSAAENDQECTPKNASRKNKSNTAATSDKNYTDDKVDFNEPKTNSTNRKEVQDKRNEDAKKLSESSNMAEAKGKKGQNKTQEKQEFKKVTSEKLQTSEKAENQQNDDKKTASSDETIDDSAAVRGRDPENDITIYFHVVIAKDFGIKVNEDRVIVRAGNIRGFKKWKSTVCELHCTKEVKDLGLLYVGHTQISKEHLDKYIPYKYLVLGNKHEEWEHIYCEAEDKSQIINRCLYIPASYAFKGEWHQYDDVCLKKDESFLRKVKYLLRDEYKPIYEKKKKAGEVMLSSIYSILETCDEINLTGFFQQLQQFHYVTTQSLLMSDKLIRWSVHEYDKEKVPYLMMTLLNKICDPFLDKNKHQETDIKLNRIVAGLLCIWIVRTFSIHVDKEHLTNICCVLCLDEMPREKMTSDLQKAKTLFVNFNGGNYSKTVRHTNIIEAAQERGDTQLQGDISRTDELLRQLFRQCIDENVEHWIWVLPVLHTFSHVSNMDTSMSNQEDVWAGLEGIVYENLKKYAR
ncbi:E3 ubiquitin-protein ligase rnf213-alpha-like [Dendropsophus ebraccatus]|uniref:E3 ubiquitin-protein ligase rnf213-alpha-like n=1 Tax=Dendropsophus ebraccatus TaxID=150705 RepID=UPI00383103AF